MPAHAQQEHSAGLTQSEYNICDCISQGLRANSNCNL